MPDSPTPMIVVFIACLLSAGISALAARAGQNQPEAPAPWWGAGAVGLGYAIAHAALAMPSFPPLDVTDRLPILAGIAAVVAMALAWGRHRLWIRVIAFAGLAALVILVMLGPVLGAGEYSEETILQLVTVSGVCLAATVNLGLLDQPTRGRELPVALSVLAAGAGIVLILSNSAVLFLLSEALACVLAASLLGAWKRPISGAVPVAATVLAALLIEGSVYAFLPPLPAILLAATPLLLWILRIGPITRLGSATRAILATVAMLIPVAIAIILTLASKTESGYGI